MNLQTPRRRVSPRTKRRYRAIKNFLRRTLGSSCQLDNKINSSICVSVSNLEQKIVGIEQQLNTVSKHCHDLASLKYNLKSSTTTSITNVQNNVDSKKNIETYPARENEAKDLYKTVADDRWKPNNSRPISKVKLYNDESRSKIKSQSKMTEQIYPYKENERSKRHNRYNSIQEYEQTLRTRKHRRTLENYKASYPLKSFHYANESRIFNHRQDAGFSGIYRNKKGCKQEYLDTVENITKQNNEQPIAQRRADHKYRNYKNKHEHPELDQDYIADIIRRQYRPIKLFGRRDSDFSQFSAPVCRDQEYSFHKTMQEGNELCSCCHEIHKRHNHSKYMCSNDCCDIRSICDTRLYSSRKHKHPTNRRKRLEDYNDSAIYDIVPVKEKSSPKSRQKFAEENILMYNKYKEVLPSPRTQRPRLNLQAQFHTDDEEGLNIKKQLRHSAQYKSPVQNYDYCSNISSDVFTHNRNGKRLQKTHVLNKLNYYNSEVVELQRNVQNPLLNNERGTNNNDITLTTQSTDMSVDKTDKTLSEIKEMLQSFLLEIKKDTSQNHNINITSQSAIQQCNLNETQQHFNTGNAVPNCGNSFNNNNIVGQCRPSLLPPFPNPCCYSILPVCPMNCVQSGFVVSSPSFTCPTCANDSKEATLGTKKSANKENSEETQNLIKEIHKLISQTPNAITNKESCKANNPTTTTNEINRCEIKTLKSRSIGGSARACKHDAKVGTPTMKCYSKSCEAIGSRIYTNRQTKVANVSYSDTVLEKDSSEEGTTVQSSSESNYSSNRTVHKKKRFRFKNVLRAIGLIKKNKKEAIEELSEADSSTQVAKPSKSPFQQHIINYNVHDQKYFQPIPTTPSYPYYQKHRPNVRSIQTPWRNRGSCYSHTHVHSKTKDFNRKRPHNQCMRSHCPSPCDEPMTPFANYYDPHYGNISPRVPLCLKEIEVKSIGTQSVRKISLLQKITNKMRAPEWKTKTPLRKQSWTETAKIKSVKNLFDWKKLQETAMQNNTDPLQFSYKTQKQLAESNIKMRDAMLKKMLYKRNPFSPRNVLLRTLLGRDQSSFDKHPKIYKPRMFL